MPRKKKPGRKPLPPDQRSIKKMFTLPPEVVVYLSTFQNESKHIADLLKEEIARTGWAPPLPMQPKHKKTKA